MSTGEENKSGMFSQSEPKREYVSITEAAEINKVTRQAIYVAIKLNKLKAKKESSRWTIHVNDLAEYRRQKYSRKKSTYNGELLFDNEKGYFSVKQVAEMLGVPVQKIYYATRIGRLPAQRKGSAWVCHIDDVRAYKESNIDNRSQGQQAG